MRRTSLPLALFVAWLSCDSTIVSAKSGRGVLVKFEQKGPRSKTDFAVLPNFEIYIPEENAPSAFLESGAWESEWNAEVRVARRENYRFTIETSGTVQLYLKEKLVLEAKGANAISDPIELGRGYNPIKLRMSSPASGDAFLRLRWESRDWVQGPLPERFLKYTSEDSEFLLAQQLREGKELFETYRCLACHVSGIEGSPEPSLEAAGPSFVGIGSRRQKDWIESWVKNPQAMRETASMPDLLHGESESGDAAAIAAWLSSQRDESESEARGSYTNGDPDAGAHLVDALHCSGCHQIRDREAEGDNLISLETLDQKFLNGALVSFLLNPSQHFPAVRMPNFQLSTIEAEDIASFLLNSELPTVSATDNESELIERGRGLVSSRGCIHCHTAPTVKDRLPTQPLQTWEKGCLDTGLKKPGVPDFQFTAAERTALKAFGKRGFDSLQTVVLHEYAASQVETLNCAACHGVVESLPTLSLMGEKLKPEWLASILEGTLFYKPRPWLESRMPAFASRGERIAQGLAMLNGYPPTSSRGSEPEEDLVAVGQKLISANGGLACVTCHAVGDMPATAVFESNGINFAYANERLQPDFFHRWILKPTQIDPETKMPVYFFGGESPLPDILEGNATDQIKAIWEYFKQGFDIEAPE